jgi:hypothetical protein
VSKPPRVQKKIWRLSERDVWFNLMTLATCLSWLPIPVLGKTVVKVGSVPPSEAMMSTACWVASLAAATRVADRSMVRRKSIELRRATSAADVVNPFKTRTWFKAVGAGAIASGRVERP